MQFKDYYSVLGVKHDASEAEIKRSYRKLARKYHPDVSREAGAEQRMKEVNEAYEVLKDPEKRAAYDELSKRYAAGQEFSPPPDWDAGFEFSGGFAEDQAADFSDFFAELFGRGARRPRREAYGGRGEDHHAKISIDLEDAFHGATRAVSLRVPQVDARGRVALRQHTLNVQIPAGVRNGQHIRLQGQGAAGIGGGPPGDLYLEVHIKEHPLYRLSGADIFLTLPVAPWEAALGAKVKIPTPAGALEVTLPAGSQSGRKLRLKGRGLPGAAVGDLYLVLDVVLPKADSERARELFADMARELAFNPREALGV